MTRLKVGLVFVLLIISINSAADAPVSEKIDINRSIDIGGLEATPGRMVSGFMTIAAGVDEGTQIPVSVIHGSKTGPVLTLIAGTHGYEYAPIIALQNVRADLDPNDLSGTVVIVHIANMPSFLGRTIYYSPIDGKNLNRQYPGNKQGSVSERIAYAITTEIIAKSDYVIDMHAGDGNEALRPYIYMPETGDAEFDRTIKDMAMAFGIDHIIIDRAEIPEFESAIFTDATALSLGKPAMTTETGQMGASSAEWTDIAETGVWNLLRHLDMVKGENRTVAPIVWLGRYKVINSPGTGIFKPLVKEGYMVAEGGKLGELVDFFGEKITDIKAPFKGIVNYIVATPPISEGEPVAMMSELN